MLTWARNTLMHHLWCKRLMSGCDPDWHKQIPPARPRCLHCRRIIP